MYDELLEEDPWVKEKVAEGEAKGKAEGRTEGASRELVRLVQGRFPALLRLAKARITNGESLDVLDALIEHLWAASDEQAARQLLEAHPVS